MFFRLKMHAKAGDADRISKVLQDKGDLLVFPGVGFWWCPRLGLLHNGRREARLHPVWSGETFRRYTYRAPRTVSRGEVAKGHSARQS